MTTAQQISTATAWLRDRADWDNDTGDVARTILHMLSAPTLGRAIELIEKRRETYIRENCKSVGNGGDWEGTVAQEEYVAELDDIIEMLRTSAPEATSDRRIVTCARRHRSTVPTDAFSTGTAATHSCPVCGIGVPKERTSDQRPAVDGGGLRSPVRP